MISHIAPKQYIFATGVIADLLERDTGNMEDNRPSANANGADIGDKEQSRKVKRVGFVGSSGPGNDSENTNTNTQRRGTPHPRKKLKGSSQDEGADKETATAVPPLVFGRSESTSDNDPQELHTSNETGAEMSNREVRILKYKVV